MGKPKKGRKGLKGTLAVLGGIAMLVLFGEILLGVNPFHGKKEAVDEIRSLERTELKKKIDRTQEELLSASDWEKIISSEAQKILTEKPRPVQDATQRARQLPLVAP